MPKSYHQWLRDFAITLEGEIKRIESKITVTAELYGLVSRGGTISKTLHQMENSGFQESIRKRQVLLKHITAVQEARKTTAQSKPEPTRDERRAARLERIRKMRLDQSADLKQMRDEGCDEESVRRRDNMWNDAIRREEDEYAKEM